MPVTPFLAARLRPKIDYELNKKKTYVSFIFISINFVKIYRKSIGEMKVFSYEIKKVHLIRGQDTRKIYYK